MDFIVGDMRVAIEAKATANVTSDHLKGLRRLVGDHPEVRRRVVVSLEGRAGKTPDGVEVLPAGEFLSEAVGRGPVLTRDVRTPARPTATPAR